MLFEFAALIGAGLGVFSMVIHILNLFKKRIVWEIEPNFREISQFFQHKDGARMVLDVCITNLSTSTNTIRDIYIEFIGDSTDDIERGKFSAPAKNFKPIRINAHDTKEMKIEFFVKGLSMEQYDTVKAQSLAELYQNFQPLVDLVIFDSLGKKRKFSLPIFDSKYSSNEKKLKENEV